MTFNSYGKAIVLLTQQSLKTVCKGYKMPLNLMEMLLYNNSNNTNSNNTDSNGDNKRMSQLRMTEEAMRRLNTARHGVSLIKE